MENEHDIIRAYLESNPLSQQQIDSYNRFVGSTIHKIVEGMSVIEPNIKDYSIKLGGLRFAPPMVVESDGTSKRIMPHEAAARNLNYSALIYATYTPMISGIPKVDDVKETIIGELPVMVRSSMCYTRNMTREQLVQEHEDPYDPGGYFIIKGTERVLVGIEDIAPNRMLSSTDKKGSAVTSVTSTTLNFRAKCSVTRDKYGIYTVMFPTISKGIDIILVLRALGLNASDVIKYISNNDARNDMLLNIESSESKEVSDKDVLMHLGKISAPNQAAAYQIKRAESQLDMYILPHLGTEKENRAAKARYIIKMADRASLQAYGYIKKDDKDSYANKRVKLAGDLLEELFTSAFKALVKDISYRVERTNARGRKMTMHTNINPDTLKDRILYAMGTGSWPTGQTGVSEVLDRINFPSSLAHIRRVKSTLAKKHPNYPARDVHGTTIGKICPTETPEGTAVGLTKYLALMAKVTIGADENQVIESMKKLELV
jgi:DNA-directed RNA polymerase beta subunit